MSWDFPFLGISILLVYKIQPAEREMASLLFLEADLFPAMDMYVL